MIAKVTVTTVCGAKCKTCPSWKTPKKEMSYDKFCEVFDMLNDSPLVSGIFLNSVGDMYWAEDGEKMLRYAEEKKKKVVTITTNASKLGYIPKLDAFIISFNGGTKEAYEKVTGLSWDLVVGNIRAKYKELSMVRSELHCLICELNQGTEQELLKTWHDFPGRIRVSYKYDNQMQEDLTVEKHKRKDRIPCDYLSMIVIHPDGSVVKCSHDFWGEEKFGNLFTDGVEWVAKASRRLKAIAEHVQGQYSGICERCNYNTPAFGKIVYLK